MRVSLKVDSTFDARTADRVHHVLFEAEFLVVLVVGVVDFRRTALAVAVDRQTLRLVQDRRHLVCDLRPCALAASFVHAHFARVEPLTFLLRPLCAGVGECARRLHRRIGVEARGHLTERAGGARGLRVDLRSRILPVCQGAQRPQRFELIVVCVVAEFVRRHFREIRRDIPGVECAREMRRRAGAVAGGIGAATSLELRADGFGERTPGIVISGRIGRRCGRAVFGRGRGGRPEAQA